MAARKDEALPLAIAAQMSGFTVRALASLVRQGQVKTATAPEPQKGRGRPAIFVSRRSLEDCARNKHRLVRDISPKDKRGRSETLSFFLNSDKRLMGIIKRARITEIYNGEGGRVWVRFHASKKLRRTLLTHFWRQDADRVFGSRVFNITFDGREADVYIRVHDEEGDRFDLERCVAAAAGAVAREDARLEERRSKPVALADGKR